ncbi:MAG: hypothetical protein Q7T55_14520 [Solirubrobacteraceae bacterium]|nr:hypothetical protein [Solirubrobacteraceae bacterium]
MRRSVPSSTRDTATAGLLRLPSLPIRAGFLALTTTVMLAGCGGGDDKGSSDAPAGTGAQAAVVDPSSPEAGQAPTKEEETGIQGTNAAAYAAVKGKDGEAFCALLTKQAKKILTAGSVEKGSTDEKCATIATKITQGVNPGDVTPERLSSIKVNGDKAVGRTGDRVTQFEKIDGKWLLGISQGPAEVQETTP